MFSYNITVNIFLLISAVLIQSHPSFMYCTTTSLEAGSNLSPMCSFGNCRSQLDATRSLSVTNSVGLSLKSGDNYYIGETLFVALSGDYDSFGYVFDVSNGTFLLDGSGTFNHMDKCSKTTRVWSNSFGARVPLVTTDSPNITIRGNWAPFQTQIKVVNPITLYLSKASTPLPIGNVIIPSAAPINSEANSFLPSITFQKTTKPSLISAVTSSLNTSSEFGSIPPVAAYIAITAGIIVTFVACFALTYFRRGVALKQVNSDRITSGRERTSLDEGRHEESPNFEML